MLTTPRALVADEIYMYIYIYIYISMCVWTGTLLNPVCIRICSICEHPRHKPNNSNNPNNHQKIDILTDLSTMNNPNNPVSSDSSNPSNPSNPNNPQHLPLKSPFAHIDSKGSENLSEGSEKLWFKVSMHTGRVYLYDHSKVYIFKLPSLSLSLFLSI